jgi:hypothetical protein
MAEDIRNDDSAQDIAANYIKAELVAECAREEESALYTSTIFYIWLRVLRWVRGILWFVAVVASGLAASHILRGDSGMKVFMALAALAGSLVPGIIRALKIDTDIRTYAEAAGKLKALQGEFRRARLVWSKKDFDTFEDEARKLFKQMNEVRKLSLTPPDLCYKLARRKIKAGHYTHDSDQAAKDAKRPAA